MLKILLGIGLGFLLFSNQGARQTTADILRFGADALAPEVDGPTLQEQINWDTLLFRQAQIAYRAMTLKEEP